MSKGAKPININLTKLENKISKLIAKDLKKENIFFCRNWFYRSKT